jgi:hypothetical protein
LIKIIDDSRLVDGFCVIPGKGCARNMRRPAKLRVVVGMII